MAQCCRLESPKAQKLKPPRAAGEYHLETEETVALSPKKDGPALLASTQKVHFADSPWALSKALIHS
jgi:hypothetical protein